ncbi:MAG: hypothetical protein GKC00_06145 [Candidatus Methanofastidiosa archaeon]|nr:hypothetical protein [Candidatus Methanofastidiosa archaeon]
MDLMAGAEGQFTNKLLIDISGTIKGFVKNVDIEMVEGKILIHMKLGQSAESYGLSRSESKLLRFETKITIVSDEIVSVGKDCIVVSKGKLPPLEEIKKAKMYKAENDSLKIKLNELNDELENSLRKLKVLKEDKSELEFKLNKMLKMEEEFSELRLKCAKLEGEVEGSRRFIRQFEGPNTTSKSSQFANSTHSYKPVEEEIEETLDIEKQKKFEDIMKDEFTLFGEKETVENEETIVSVNETNNEESEKKNINISNENPFKKFSKEYKKED